jgi:hypothetical protein
MALRPILGILGWSSINPFSTARRASQTYLDLDVKHILTANHVFYRLVLESQEPRLDVMVNYEPRHDKDRGRGKNQKR